MQGGLLSFQRSWEGFLPPNSVVMAKRTAALVPAEAVIFKDAVARVKFGFEIPTGLPAAERALLDKILAALELPADQYVVVESAGDEFPPAAVAAEFVVRFVVEPSGAARAGTWESSGVRSTYSLRAMLADPALKKPVWTHLKEVLARARSSG